MFNTLSLTALANAYNAAINELALTEKPVKKFKDKATGVARVTALMEANGLAPLFDANTVDLIKPETEDETADHPENAGTGNKPKKARKAKGGKRGPAPEYADSAVITVLVANPKRPGSAAYARYALYVDGGTVGDAVKAGLRRDDFRWDTAHGHISIAE